MCHELASMRYLVRADLRGGRRCGVLVKEKKYEEQTEGNGWIGWGVCCGHGGGDGLGWMGCGRVENAGGEGPGAASYRAESHQPDDFGRGHHFAATRFAGKENAGNWAEYVPFRYEAQKFWPIYNHYVKDLQGVNNQKYALLKQYAQM